MSESEISVPMESSAAAFIVDSSSSGKMVSNEVLEAFVRKPEHGQPSKWKIYR